MDNNFVLRGTVVYSRNPEELITYEDAFLVCKDGYSGGVFRELPEEYRALPVTETGGKLILPGLIDLHVHASQFQYRGSGMDMELLSWLEKYTFPEESRYSDINYAEKAYGLFVEEMRTGATTRAAVFATSHRESTFKLMEMLEETGIVTFVGKVNMDRNVPDYYVEGTEESLSETEKWLEKVKNAGFRNTRPIITPRFTPSCTRELMKGLSGLAKKYSVPVQSHLSENRSEVGWVKELEPDTESYTDSYRKAGLIDRDIPCIMAHCVWCDDAETEILKENGVFIAHSPESNMNLTSGVAPVAKYLGEGMNVGLASDVAAGSTTSMFAAMRNAIYASKLRHRLYDTAIPSLTFPEVFYLATKGGGAFFGNAGSFEKGCPFDALVIDDMAIPTTLDFNAAERAERFAYTGDERYIKAKYVSGKKIFEG